METQDFGWALMLLRAGHKVARVGWNGAGMWLVLVPGTPKGAMTEGSVYHRAGVKEAAIGAHIDMFTAKGIMQPGWLASQADMLAEDWVIVE
jgi:hypothetical protein